MLVDQRIGGVADDVQQQAGDGAEQAVAQEPRQHAQGKAEEGHQAHGQQHEPNNGDGR